MPKVLLPLLTVSAIAGTAILWSHPTLLTKAPIVKATPPEERAVIEAVSGDSMSHPPVRQTFTGGGYQLVVSAEDGWETPLSRSEFYDGPTLRWQKDLPHQYGPRFALVSERGQVLLLDEFINVASPHALTLINAESDIIKQSSFEDIQQALKVTPAELTRAATSGWWISAPPTLNEATQHALVSTGGAMLEIDLTTGELSRRADL